jgi:hypothetical protein
MTILNADPSPNHHYQVDGLTEPGGLDGPGMRESDPEIGVYPPFAIFMPGPQDYLPGTFETREEAETICATLNNACGEQP